MRWLANQSVFSIIGLFSLVYIVAMTSHAVYQSPKKSEFTYAVKDVEIAGRTEKAIVPCFRKKCATPISLHGVEPGRDEIGAMMGMVEKQNFWRAQKIYWIDVSIAIASPTFVLLILAALFDLTIGRVLSPRD